MGLLFQFSDLVCPAVESWNLRGTLQEAAAAFGEVLRHTGVKSGNAT